MSKRIWIANLGPKVKETQYELRGKQTAAELSTIALLQLLQDNPPDQLIVLATEKAKDTALVKLESEVRDVPITSVVIPSGTNEEELWEILKTILDSVPSDVELTLDITQGFRSVSFLFYTASVYLTALKGVSIKGIYYAMHEASSDIKPFLDLKILIDLVEWFYAVKLFKETGQASSLVSLLAPYSRCPEGISGRDCQEYSRTKGIRNSLDSFSNQYSAALPLELGMEARSLATRLETVPSVLLDNIPLFNELALQLRMFAEGFVLEERTSRKLEIQLSIGELAREMRLAKSYLEKGHVNEGLGLLREIIVSCVMFHHGEEDWILPKERAKAEKALGSLYDWNREKLGSLSMTQIWLAELWGEIGQKRNELHHHGFRGNTVILDGMIASIRAYLEDIESKYLDSQYWQLGLSPEKTGRLLVSPLGMSPGALYSALVCLKPDALLVVSSEEAQKNMKDIVERARFNGDVYTVTVSEPYIGFKEKDRVIGESRSVVYAYDHVYFNLTGGTTVLQYLVQSIYESMPEMGRQIHRVALVDRRGVEEQREAPYVLGEIVELDFEEEND